MIKLPTALLAAALVLAGTGAAIGMAEVDRSVAPGEDFYGYANGAWLKATRLPEGVGEDRHDRLRCAYKMRNASAA